MGGKYRQRLHRPNLPATIPAGGARAREESGAPGRAAGMLLTAEHRQGAPRRGIPRSEPRSAAQAERRQCGAEALADQGFRGGRGLPAAGRARFRCWFHGMVLLVLCKAELYCPVGSREAGEESTGAGGYTLHVLTGGRAVALVGAGQAAGTAERVAAGDFLSPSASRRANTECKRAWALIFEFFFLVSGSAMRSAIRLTHVQLAQPFKGVRRDTPKGFFFPFSFWVEDIKEVSVVWQFY